MAQREPDHGVAMARAEKLRAAGRDHQWLRELLDRLEWLEAEVHDLRRRERERR